MKFPGTALAYAMLMSIFGESPTGIHIGLLIVNIMTAGFVFLLGRHLLGEMAGATAAAAYAVLSLMPHVLGQAAHASHFVVLFVISGAVILLRALDRQSQSLLFASGSLFGLAMLMKQPGVFFVFFGLFFLLITNRHKRISGTQIILRSSVFVAGVILPCALAALGLWLSGVFDKFWFWTIQYAGQYGTRLSLREAVEMFSGHFFSAIGTAWPIWTMAIIGLVIAAGKRSTRAQTNFVLTFTLFSALAVCPGFYFRPHYFILLLPAVSLLAGAAFGFLCEAWSHRPAMTAAALMLFGLCVAWPIWSESDFFFQRPLSEANRMVNGTNPFPESIKIGEFIREHSDANDRTAVLGSEPQIYFYSGRQSATGYIYTYALMEPQPYARQMQQEMIREIEEARPKFLVLVVINKSWLAEAGSDQTIFRWADSYCEANYEEIGLINISDGETEYFLSGKPPNVRPTAEHILLYRRKT